MFAVLLAAPVMGQEIPRYTIRQGDVAVIRLDEVACAQPLRAFDSDWRCRPDHTAIIAVPPDATVGDLVTDDRTVATITVIPVAWPSVYLPKSRRGTTPPSARQEADRRAKQEVYASHTRADMADYHLRGPLWSPTVTYRVASPFWLQRFYGRDPVPQVHLGVDLSSPKPGGWNVNPPPTYSIASGIVVLAHRLWSEGNTVIVYHGDGMYTAYCHLSRITVTVGSMVAGGHRIGTLGSTGHSYGVHLHLTMRVNGIPVDPLMAIVTLNDSLR